MTDKVKKTKTFSLSTEKGDPRGSRGDSSRPPDWLEKALQDVYGPVLDEPMPDEFLDLLDQLEDRDKNES
ncbi:MAG TPA: NepR family anti-sigma factor [Kiloniellaceae bacterium]|nr:NepR family anti-sigma factor [Kiloniellaceae bacterium]